MQLYKIDGYWKTLVSFFQVSYRVIAHQRVVSGSRGARRPRQSLQRRKLSLEIMPYRKRNRGKETGSETGSEGLPVLLVLPSRRARHVCRFYPVNQNHINHISNLILMHPSIFHTSNWLSNQSINQLTGTPACPGIPSTPASPLGPCELKHRNNFKD